MMQVSLFISNFKNYKKYISVFVLSALFLFMLFLSHCFLWYILVDDTNSYTRIMMHELYNQDTNVDVLFLGSSHCYRSLIPDVTDDIFEANTFNAGSSAQAWDGSYALLVEAGKKYDLKKVYVEMFYEMAGSEYSERDNMTATYIISDYMRPSLNRIRYLTEAGNEKNWIHAFFPERRNWKKIFERQYISRLMNKKRTSSYKEYAYIGNPDIDTEYYAGKGFVAEDGVIGKDDYFAEEHFASAERTLSEDDIRSLERIIRYCRKNNIELTFFSAPMSDFRLVDAGDYDDYIRCIQNFSLKYNVKYYDFNLCRKEYFSYDSNLFKDTEHLNTLGAQKFSEIFAEFFHGEISKKDLFYSSYEEKMNAEEKKFLGCIYQRSELENGKIITFEPIVNGGMDYSMAILKNAAGMEEYESVQVAGKQVHVMFPVNETGELRVSVFDKSDKEYIIDEVIIEY